MRAWIALLFVMMAFSACGPANPTGMASSAISDSGEVRIAYATLSEESPFAVKIFVRGDVVSQQFFVDGQSYALSGRADGEWIVGDGSAIVYLDAGRYTVSAVSCSESFLETSCERIARDIRIPS